MATSTRRYVHVFRFPLLTLTVQPKWYTLHSKLRGGRKKHEDVSGQIQLQFSLLDPSDPEASPDQVLHKFKAVVAGDGDGDDDDDANTVAPVTSSELADAANNDETSDEADPDRQQRRLRLARLKRKSIAARAYEFSSSKDGVSGIVFMEVNKVVDLPPEKNSEWRLFLLAVFIWAWSRCPHGKRLPLTLAFLPFYSVTRTSFDMDPFVVTSLGRKTLRTRVIRHNLNPIFDEKMVFQVRKHEQNYSFNFSVVDRDKLSGNDFVASANFPLQTLILSAPVADPETGLYQLPGLDPSQPPPPSSRSRFRLPLSRSASSSSLGKPRPPLRSKASSASLSSQSQLSQLQEGSSTQLDVPKTHASEPPSPTARDNDDGFKTYLIPLGLKNRERWEDKHFPDLHIRAKYMPYAALRQQFWRVMLKQYDADDSGRISKVELVTMLDTLGSTLKEATIDDYFHRFAAENEPSETVDLSFDQAVICLEETLQSLQKKNVGSQVKNLLHHSSSNTESENQSSGDDQPTSPLHAHTDPTGSSSFSLEAAGEDAALDPDDLVDERDEEHVIELSECPLCHQPRLSKRTDADIITHIATCASQDWRQVDNLVMGGFVTSSQAQRKWYSKVITKISYGGYKLGANSANILIQDRITGQINEERMSVYVRLGIRLLYKGLKSREMEKKRSMLTLIIDDIY